MREELPGSGWSLRERDPETIRRLMPLWEWFYRYYFRVETQGWERLPEGRVLVVGSHNGGLSSPDMIMMIYDWFRHQGYQRRIYGLMHPTVWKISRPLAELAVKVGAVQAHPRMALAALQSGASVLVYPGGAQDVFRPFSERHRIHFAGRKGFIKLALRENVPIVPVLSLGAHETLYVIGDCYEQMKQLHDWGLPWLFNIDPVVFPVYLGLPWGLALGPLPHLPLPLKMRTYVGEPIRFELSGADAANDRIYVQACYDRVVKTMQSQLDALVAAAPKNC